MTSVHAAQHSAPVMQNVAMAGRHAAMGVSARPPRLGSPWEVRRNPELFYAYLEHFSVRTYLRDFFSPPEHHSAIVGFICGVLFFVAGFTRLVTQPDWRSLGVILVGSAVTALCLLAPLLADLAVASTARLTTRSRGRRRLED
ncbi:MAG: hypothetical protein ACTHOG_10510 [Marmoricola sp.]